MDCAGWKNAPASIGKSTADGKGERWRFGLALPLFMASSSFRLLPAASEEALCCLAVRCPRKQLLGQCPRLVFYFRHPMDDTNSLIEQRRAKLAALRAKGIDPFSAANKFTPAETCAQARAAYAEGREVTLAGRITAHRDMGKSMFLDIRDQSDRLQVYAQKNVLGDEQFDIFRHLDLGDFIGVRGTMFITRTGEISVKIASFTILTKALRPPPAKWHGLEDTEIRYRQRYLDLMANPDVKDVLLKRSAIIREVRNFLHERGYVEVETPMMQAIPGGAAARPFKTHHNALGCDFYLRIAIELYLKRLLVGGVDKVFEIGKNFRNEGLSRRHNPEFTMLEAYQAFGDYESMMELVQSMVCHVAQKVLGTLVIEHKQEPALTAALDNALRVVDEVATNLTGTLLKNATGEVAGKFVAEIGNVRATLVTAQGQVGTAPVAEIAKTAIGAILVVIGFVSLNKIGLSDGNKPIEGILSNAAGPFDSVVQSFEKLLTPKTINLTPPWRRVTYRDLVRERAGGDWFELSVAERRERAAELGAEITPEFEDFEVTQAVFEKLIEPTLINQHFVTHAPKELIPLAKLSPDDPTTVEVFECCINGQEIAPAYTEQNDPIAQRERLEHQAGGEQQKLDEDFLVALEHGMPPAGGMGMGMDRLCMMLLGQESIRDVILFPQLKPK
jgi:lysyl-tRNA synthetase class 2